MDCEGFERDVFQPDSVSALTDSDLLIETHDFLVPGVSDALAPLFQPTHHLKTITIAPRSPAQFGPLASLPQNEQAQALVEGRDPRQTWLWVTSKRCS